jgi:CCR4-NOT transcription complex subunit 1
MQYAAPGRLAPNSMVVDEKIALMMPEQFSSHTLAQVSPSQAPLASLSPSPLSLSQVCHATIFTHLSLGN